MSNVWCPISNVQCLMSNIQYPMSNVQCPMSNVWCPISNVQCLMSNVQYPMSNVQCPMFGVQSQMSNIQSILQMLCVLYRTILLERKIFYTFVLSSTHVIIFEIPCNNIPFLQKSLTNLNSIFQVPGFSLMYKTINMHLIN